jgi:hypothetical protein
MVRFGCGGVNYADPEVINCAFGKPMCICEVRRRVGGESNQCIGPDSPSRLKRRHVILSNMHAVYCGAIGPCSQEHFDSVIDQNQGTVADSVRSTYYKIVKV